jgi:hypothetical protein
MEGFPMTTPLDNFMSALEKRKQQLDDVLEAYRLFRQKLDALPPELAQEAERMLSGGNGESPAATETVVQDLVGKTSLQCARVILAEGKNAPLHFSKIAREAIHRGYKGRTTGDRETVENRISTSFWAALSRAEDVESTGRGYYKLKEQPP